jgi:hypothetical protein
MERGYHFTVDLPGDATYIVRLLEGVQIENRGGTAIGRWPSDVTCTDASTGHFFRVSCESYDLG